MTFSLYSPSEIRSLSACQVTSPQCFNDLGHPVPGGLYDLRMGPFTDRGDLLCSTCLLTADHCPGHVGHVDLPMPVCNPLFYGTILQLLKISCVRCHRFRFSELEKELFLVRQSLLEQGMIVEAQDAAAVCAANNPDEALNEGDESATGQKKRKKKAEMNAAEEIAGLQRLRQYATDVTERQRQMQVIEG